MSDTELADLRERIKEAGFEIHTGTFQMTNGKQSVVYLEPVDPLTLSKLTTQAMAHWKHQKEVP